MNEGLISWDGDDRVSSLSGTAIGDPPVVQNRPARVEDRYPSVADVVSQQPPALVNLHRRQGLHLTRALPLPGDSPDLRAIRREDPDAVVPDVDFPVRSDGKRLDPQKEVLLGTIEASDSGNLYEAGRIQDRWRGCPPRRRSEAPPDGGAAAAKLIEGMEKALEADSGSFIDVRDMAM